MLRLLSYLIGKGVVTNADVAEFLDEACHGLPKVTQASCDDECQRCVAECPTEAIVSAADSVIVDLGACIGCNACVATCPTGTLAPDLSTKVWSSDRLGLIRSNATEATCPVDSEIHPFRNSMAIRVLSTGCSACDLEVQAAFNPLFDLERFGISVVASPRFADALLITGPVPKALHGAVLSTYAAMADPKIVIACGSCAISGGVHAHGYAQADGVVGLLPVDVFIPGCAPHPWQIIRALLAAKNLPGRRQLDGEKTLPASDVAALQKVEDLLAQRSN